MYHRYLQLFNIGQILVIKTYLCSSNRCKNLTILIKINISLLYACILVQYIEETSGRTDTGRQAGRGAGTDIMSSIPYVNGGTLLFQLPPIMFVPACLPGSCLPGSCLPVSLCPSAHPFLQYIALKCMHILMKCLF